MASRLITPDLRNAFFAFRLAENEFNRPNEDVVALCACNKMRTSVEQFLRSYLRQQDVSFSSGDSFDDLLQRCGGVDMQFQKINLSCFVCNHETEGDKKYCFSADKMKECFNQTQVIKNLVLTKLNLSEKDFEQAD